MSNFEQMRELFIDVKKDHFKTFMQNADVFEDDEMKNLNKTAYQYFVDLENRKKLTFQNHKLFWKLYKYENFGYSFQNFLILNIPKLARILFKLKKG